MKIIYRECEDEINYTFILMNKERYFEYSVVNSTFESFEFNSQLTICSP